MRAIPRFVSTTAETRGLNRHESLSSRGWRAVPALVAGLAAMLHLR